MTSDPPDGPLSWNELPFVKRQRAAIEVDKFTSDRVNEPPDDGRHLSWTKRFEQKSRPTATPLSARPVTTTPTAYAVRALESEAGIVAATPEGARNGTLNTAAFRMGQLVGGGTVDLATVRQALATAGLASGLDEKEVALVLRDDDTGALHQGQLEPRIPQPMAEPPDVTVLAATEAEVDAADQLERDLDAEYIDSNDLGNLPTPEPLIETVLPRHAYGILRGRDQSFKSFVGLDWALCLATGRPWQGHRSEMVRVLYIAGEGAHGLEQRIEAWKSVHGISVPVGAFTVRKSALNLFKPNPAFPHLLQLIETGEYALVVVDTLRRVSGSADGNGSDMGAVVDNLDRIKRATRNGTVLAIAHTDKGDNDTRGYSGIEDDADVVWAADRDDTLLVLKNTKQKDGPEHGAIHLRSRPVLDSLVLEGSEAIVATTTESQIAILATMRRAFRDGTYGTALKDASGLSKSTYYDALADLVDGGHVIKSGKPARPFYELPYEVVQE
jgi:hypothetical protein